METQEPHHDDCFILCNGWIYSVSREAKFVGEFVEFTDAINALNELQDNDQFYYDMWFINDHGNIDMMDRCGNFINEPAL